MSRGLWLVAALALGLPLQAQVSVYKCVDDQGKVSYQQSPCPELAEQESMSVSGDTEANLAAAEEAAARRLAAERERQRVATRDALVRAAQPQPSATPRPAPDAPAVKCPATYENPGVLKPKVTDYYYDENGRRQDVYDSKELRMRYKSLPTKTYLKNAGLWPKGCPD